MLFRCWGTTEWPNSSEPYLLGTHMWWQNQVQKNTQIKYTASPIELSDVGQTSAGRSITLSQLRDRAGAAGRCCYLGDLSRGQQLPRQESHLGYTFTKTCGAGTVGVREKAGGILLVAVKAWRCTPRQSTVRDGIETESCERPSQGWGNGHACSLTGVQILRITNALVNVGCFFL